MTDSMLRLTMALADRYRIERELGQGGMDTCTASFLAGCNVIHHGLHCNT
jgi:hypothetical protein